MPGITRSEIIRPLDISRRVINLTAAVTLNLQAHAGKVLLLNAVAGFTVTLPDADGTGAIYHFRVQAVLTSNTYVVQVANSTDQMVGTILSIDTDTADNAEGFQADAVANADTFTMNATTQGGLFRGDWVEFMDAEADLWYVRGQLSGSGDLATNFTAAV